MAGKHVQPVRSNTNKEGFMNFKTTACALSLLFLYSCGAAQSQDGTTGVNTTSSSSAITSSSSSSSLVTVATALGEVTTALANNKEKWALRNIKSYQYQYRESCFCLAEVTQNKQVTVANGVVTEAFFLQTSDYLTTEQLTRIKTVDGLFNAIENAVNAKAYRIDVSYNIVYGYPETISIDYNKDMADDEITYYAKDLM